jgi:hypothetical protein
MSLQQPRAKIDSLGWSNRNTELINHAFFAKLLTVFLILFQLTILSYVIWNALVIIEAKREVRLRSELYDPYDYMKGRYIRLNLGDFNSVEISQMESLQNLTIEEIRKVKGRPVYCILRRVDDYHIIDDLVFEKPDSDKLFIKLNINSVYHDVIYLKLHFDNYYLQEDFAVEADRILARGRNDESMNFRLVLLAGKNGQTVQKDFLVNDIPIVEYIKRGK